MTTAKAKSAVLEPKAAELTERLAQLQRGLEFEKRKLAEAERLAAAAAASSPPTPTPKATISSAAPSSVDRTERRARVFAPAATPKKSPPATKGVKSSSASASFKKIVKAEKKSVVKEEKTESEVKAAWKELIKSEDNSAAEGREATRERKGKRLPRRRAVKITTSSRRLRLRH